MYQTILPSEEAIGHILRHNLADERGRKALSKGHRLASADLPLLRALGLTALRVAVLEGGDVHEDAAARRLADAVWSYREPYEAVAPIAGHVAFYGDRVEVMVEAT